MEKSKTKKHFWGITHTGNAAKEILFSGSFKDCWKQLIMDYGDMTLNKLTILGIKIERIN